MTVKLPVAAADLRRRSAMLFLVGLTALVLAACTPVKPYIPEASQIPFGQGRIWQIDGGGPQPSYVFAVYDLRDKRALVLPEKAEAAFEDAETLVLEGVIDPYIQAELYEADNLELADDQTLEELIGARSFGTLKWHMRQSQLAPNNKTKPWVMWYYLGGANFGFFDYDSYIDNRADKSQTLWLEDRAVETGKRVVSLQSEQELFDVYDKMPLDQQADMLRVRVDSYRDRTTQVPKMKLYLDGDLARLHALWHEYLGWLQPATAQTLDNRRINDRNAVMVERMLPLMQEQSSFVALGALHLPGEEGILNLLEQRGFTVRPLL